MKKLISLFAGLSIVPLIAFAAPVLADSPGQLEGGANMYVVKNASQNGKYDTTASSTACNDVFEYSIELHNTEFGQLNNIVVNATLPGSTPSTSKMTALPLTGGTTGTSGSVTVTFGTDQKQSLSYVNGSTVLYDGSGTVIKNLPDGIATNTGVNVGSLKGSTTEFVNFKAQVGCQVPTCQNGQTGTYPNCTNPSCQNGQTGTYPNCSTPTCQNGMTGTYPNCTTPTTPPVNNLPNTGAGDTIGIGIGAVIVGTILGRLYIGRKVARSVK